MLLTISPCTMAAASEFCSGIRQNSKNTEVAEFTRIPKAPKSSASRLNFGKFSYEFRRLAKLLQCYEIRKIGVTSSASMTRLNWSWRLTHRNWSISHQKRHQLRFHACLPRFAGWTNAKNNSADFSEYLVYLMARNDAFRYLLCSQKFFPGSPTDGPVSTTGSQIQLRP